MLPTVALVGRPNVGKSTLFNRLTRTRDALVADSPGLTRDRIYGTAEHAGRAFAVVDTGGLGGDDPHFAGLMDSQAMRAVEAADVVLLLLDAREGLTNADEAIAERLRRSGARIVPVVNKADGLDAAVVVAEFHALGLGEPFAVSASHGDHMARLLEHVVSALSSAAQSSPADEPDGIGVAVIGRPNVGKSTLINRLVGEERLLASSEPGTTRDSVRVPFERHGRRYMLVDTAGVRRRSHVKESLEKLSVVKALEAIEACDVAIMLLDAREGVVEQDARLLGHAVKSGRALVLAVNKWDRLSSDQRAQTKRTLDLKLDFARYAPLHFISALHGTGIDDVMASVERAHAAAARHLSTAEVTRELERAVAAHQPPLVRGRRIKLRYAHQGGESPPVIVVHGTQADRVPAHYRRYLANRFREAFGLHGVPLRVEFRTPENPYVDEG